jgi:hypothetical protein
MQTNSDEEANTVDELAKAMGLSTTVRLSQELSELISPNAFLSGLGINLDDRLTNILSILKGNLIPKNSGKKEIVPDEGIVFPIPVTKGPYIKEELVSIKAELTNDNGEEEILLSVIREPE